MRFYARAVSCAMLFMYTVLQTQLLAIAEPQPVNLDLSSVQRNVPPANLPAGAVSLEPVPVAVSVMVSMCELTSWYPFPLWDVSSGTRTVKCVRPI